MPRIWNKRFDTVTSAKNTHQLKKVTKEMYLQTYSSEVKCDNVYCKECTKL